MKMKKLACILTTAVLLSGTVCTPSVLPDGTALFSAPLTAEAAACVSGVRTSLVYNCSWLDARLFLQQDPKDKHLIVCGCETNRPITSTFVIPEKLKVNGVDYPITEIGVNAFMSQTAIRRVSSNGGKITKIGQGAFHGCTNLESVTFINAEGTTTVKSVGPSAFGGCTALDSLDGYADQATEIGAHAFMDCTGLTAIKLTKTRTLGAAAFYGCSNLGVIDLSSAPMTAVDRHTFFSCEKAYDVRLPQTLQSIGMQAFAGCDALEKIYIPDSVTRLETAAFLECDALKTVMMSENIAYIGDYAFYCCPNMKFFVSKNPNATLGSYSVGWHLENDHAVHNKTFRIWSTGAGSVKQYANNNCFDYRSVSAAASLAGSSFLLYEWNNTSYDVNAWSVNGKYYFTEKHKKYVDSGRIDADFTGFLDGLEAVSVLTSSGYISVKDYAPGYSVLHNIQNPIPNFTKSYVGTIESRHNITSVSDYCARPKFSKEMLRYAEYITYGADAAVLFTRKNPCNGYFSACFGMEFREYASDKNDPCWNGWDARLMVYRAENRTSHNKADYIYLRFSDGSWQCGNVSSATASYITLNYTPGAILSYSKQNAANFLAAIRN